MAQKPNSRRSGVGRIFFGLVLVLIAVVAVAVGRQENPFA